MLNHVQSWLYVGNEVRPFMVLDELLGLYRLKYDSVTACRLPLYLCSYKLDGSATGEVREPSVILDEPLVYFKGNGTCTATIPATLDLTFELCVLLL